MDERPPDDITIQDVWIGLQRLTWLVDGNERYNIKGIRGELQDTKASVAALLEQRKQLKWTIAGLSVGLGITTFGTLAQILPPILTALTSSK